MDILKQFGVQPVLLVAQVVNFLILLFLLKKFLYKPILKVLDERKVKIAQSLEDAQRIEDRLSKIEAEKEKIISVVEKESKLVIDEATKKAAEIIVLANSKAQSNAQKIIDNAQKTMEQEREKLHQEIRVEIGELIALGLNKVLGTKLSEKEKEELVEGSIKELK